MPRRLQPLTPGEWDIMRVVWQMEPCAAPDVQEALHKQRKWAYTTVKTMMDRMVAKGLLGTEKIRNLSVYRARINRAEAQRGELARTIQQAFGGALAPMMQFMIEGQDLSAKDLDALEGLLREKRKAAGKSDNR
jgi:BlaI family transcriptional regulator, penicillinase repressor